MLAEKEKALFNKDGVQIGVFLSMDTYNEIEKKLQEYENIEEFLSKFEDQYLAQIALKRFKAYQRGEEKTVTVEELVAELGLFDEVQD